MARGPGLDRPLLFQVANTQVYEDALAKVKRWFTKSHEKVAAA